MSTTPTPEDHRRAKLVADRCRLDAAPWQLEHLAAAIAEIRAEGHAAALAPFEALFAGEPDTPCRTTWRNEDVWNGEARTECVELPLDELRDTFDEAERALRGEA